MYLGVGDIRYNIKKSHFTDVQKGFCPSKQPSFFDGEGARQKFQVTKSREFLFRKSLTDSHKLQTVINSIIWNKCLFKQTFHLLERL